MTSSSDGPRRRELVERVDAWPVSTSPPSCRRAPATSAVREPADAAPDHRPADARARASRGRAERGGQRRDRARSIEWAAMPANSARAAPPGRPPREPSARARAPAVRTAPAASGWRGRLDAAGRGRSVGEAVRTPATSGPNSRRHAGPSPTRARSPSRSTRALEDARPTAVERMRERRIRWMHPLDPAARQVERPEEWRRQRRAAGSSSTCRDGSPGASARAVRRPAAGRLRRFDDRDRPPGTGQRRSPRPARSARPRRRSRRGPDRAAGTAVTRRSLPPAGNQRTGAREHARSSSTGPRPLLRTFRQWRHCRFLSMHRRSVVDDRLGARPRRREIAQRRSQNLSFWRFAAQHVRELVNGSAGRSRAWAWATVTSPSRRAENVIHADEGMALRGHERERFVVGVQDQDAGRQPDRRPGHRLDLEQGDLAGRDPGQRRVEPSGPSARTRGTAAFQWAMTVGRGVSTPSRRTRERLLPQLAEPLERARDPACRSRRRPRRPPRSPTDDRPDPPSCHGRARCRSFGSGSRGGGSRLPLEMRGGGGGVRVVSVLGVARVRRSRPPAPPARRRGSRSPRRGGSARRSGGSGRTGRSRPAARPPRCARTSSVTSRPMPPLFMYSSLLKSRMTAVAPFATARP